MKYHFLLILLFFSVFVVACKITNNGNRSEVYGANYFVTESEKATLEQKALAGDGYSAYRLANYEFLFGDSREAVRWYRASYNLGYKKEESLGHYKSLEALLDEEATRSANKP